MFDRQTDRQTDRQAGVETALNLLYIFHVNHLWGGNYFFRKWFFTL